MGSAMDKFLAQFAFRPEFSGFIGIEREQFLTTDDGRYVPLAKQFLESIGSARWTYELSACQIESRTNPQKDLSAVELELLENENHAAMIAGKLGLRILNAEVGDERMPLDVYPDPRYQKIAGSISKERLLAACRVAGIHMHMGARNMDHALALNNLFAAEFDRLCGAGDHSAGERLRLYKAMAPHWRPTVYRNAEHLFQIGKDENFIENPRNCWKLIRISIHGTVELRMFGATDDINEIIEWVSLVKKIEREGL